MGDNQKGLSSLMGQNMLLNPIMILWDWIFIKL